MKAKLSTAILLCSICIFLAAFQHAASVIGKANTIDTFPFLHTIKEFKGKIISSSQGTITLSSGLHNDYYIIDTVKQLGYIYVETKLADFSNPNAKRLPLTIAIIIDRSGSMAGAKMKYAKEAAKKIIDQLNTEDYVSVIMYDHEVTVLQPSIKVVLKDSIKRKIDAIEERGSTNLWGGSEKGYEQIKASLKPAYINRILLISDGLANSGLTNARVIQNKVRHYKDEEGITLSTFGVGLDYNEVLLTDMAESGAGNYYFINDLEKMASILENEINGLSRIAAKNAELNIELPKGIEITKVYAYKASVKQNKLVIRFRDLFSKEVKGVLVQFKLPSKINTALDFTSSIQYTDVIDGNLKQLHNENKMLPTKIPEEYLVHHNKNVLEQAVLLQSNEALEKAMLEVDKGLFEGARITLQKNKSYLNQHTILFKSSKELQIMDSINQAYYQHLLKAESLGQDSFKLMQKTHRAASYNLRSKKQ